MRKAIYIIFAAWLVAGIVLKILGLVSWWVATSAIWFPLGCLITASAFFVAVADIGGAIKRKREASIPKECANCLFGKVCDQINDGKREGEEKAKCLGESVGGATRGKVCEYYQRAR